MWLVLLYICKSYKGKINHKFSLSRGREKGQGRTNIVVRYGILCFEILSSLIHVMNVCVILLIGMYDTTLEALAIYQFANAHFLCAKYIKMPLLSSYAMVVDLWITLPRLWFIYPSYTIKWFEIDSWHWRCNISYKMMVNYHGPMVDICCLLFIKFCKDVITHLLLLLMRNC